MFNNIYEFGQDWNSDNYITFLTILPKVIKQNDQLNLETFTRFLSSDEEDSKYTFEIKLNMENLPKFSSEEMFIQNLDEDKFFPLIKNSKNYTLDGKKVKDQFLEFLSEKNYPRVKDKFMMYSIH